MMERFPQRLRSLRKEQNLSQAALADYLEVSRNTVVNWEKGNSRPDARTSRKMAGRFNVSADYLCGESDERHKVMITPVSDIDISVLNAEGMNMLRKYYQFLKTQDEYCAEKASV